jgi:type I restriction enzyme S subunit
MAITIPIPPDSEQAEIAAWIKYETSSGDHAIEKARREIELLREYRTRLIADVVTGELDVRDAAARLPAELDELEQLDDTDVEPLEASDEELEPVET